MRLVTNARKMDRSGGMSVAQDTALSVYLVALATNVSLNKKASNNMLADIEKLMILRLVSMDAIGMTIPSLRNNIFKAESYTES